MSIVRNKHGFKQCTWRNDNSCHLITERKKKKTEVLLGGPGKDVIIGRDYCRYYYLALNGALYLQSVGALEI